MPPITESRELNSMNDLFDTAAPETPEEKFIAPTIKADVIPDIVSNDSDDDLGGFEKYQYPHYESMFKNND